MCKTIPILALILVVGLTLVQVGCSSDDDDPVTPPPACSITVLTPQAGQFEYTGSDISINWTKTTGGDVKIELFKGANLAGTIKPSTPNDEFYRWINLTTFGQESGEDYSIMVSHLGDSSCSGQSDLFTLEDVSNCSIRFPWTDLDSIPDLTAGNNFEITWTSLHTSGFVDLELWYEPLTNGGILVGPIAENLDDTGSYLWTVDSFHRGTGEGYRFKIKDVTFPTCRDSSGVRFSLFDEDNCSIEIFGISEGTTYPQEEVLVLSFAFENSSGVVDLKLYSGNEPVTGGRIVENFDTQNGTVNFGWNVTDFGHSGQSFSRFNIRAWDSEDEYCVGKSSTFAIAQ